MPSSVVEFSVLGAVRARLGERELNLGGPRQRAMLAMLLLTPDRLHPVDELVAGVWGEEAPARANHSLSVYASRIRDVLQRTGAGRDCVSWSGGYRLRLPSSCRVDLTEFERLSRLASTDPDPVSAATTARRALDLVDGPLLAGVPGPFARRQQARWAERYVAAVEFTLGLEVDAGRATEAVAELADLATAHPWRESAHALWMRALYLCGRQAEAFSVYESIRRRLSEELGVDPGPGLQETRLRILRGDRRLWGCGGPTASPEE